MGTTASAAIIIDNLLCVGHVGDTRVYIIRDKMIQLTKDHSLVQELIDKGDITAEQARFHSQRNVITRAVGISSNLKVDVLSRILSEGDYVLLCCDGLINEVEDDEMFNLVLKSKDSQDACERLVNLANDRGGKDNISVIVVGPLEISEQIHCPTVVKLGSEIVSLDKSISQPRTEITSTPYFDFCPRCGQPIASEMENCSNCNSVINQLEDLES